MEICAVIERNKNYAAVQPLTESSNPHGKSCFFHSHHMTISSLVKLVEQHHGLVVSISPLHLDNSNLC
jgi:hypothetical protein